MNKNLNLNIKKIVLCVLVSVFILGVCFSFTNSDEDLPDLTASINAPADVPSGGNLKDNVTIAFKNKGKAASSSFRFDLILSRNSAARTRPAVHSPRFRDSVSLLPRQISIRGIAAGNVVNWMLSRDVFVPKDTPKGDYYLICLVDPGNEVLESNEANNRAGTEIKVLGRLLVAPDIAPFPKKPPVLNKPDLVVNEISLHPAMPEFKCNIRVSLKNVGAGPLPDSAYQTGQVTMTVGTSTYSMSLADVDPGKTLQPVGGSIKFFWQHQKMTYSLNPGTYTIKIFVDATNTIVETMENNNTLEKTLIWN
jgi:hypothetical protein